MRKLKTYAVTFDKVTVNSAGEQVVLNLAENIEAMNTDSAIKKVQAKCKKEKSDITSFSNFAATLVIKLG